MSNSPSASKNARRAPAEFVLWRLVRGFFSRLRACFPRRPKIVKRYEFRSCSGIVGRVRLSNRRPRYSLEWSEPLSSWLVDDWIAFRDAALADFRKQTGIKIWPIEFGNECIRPLRPPRADDRRQRQNQTRTMFQILKSWSKQN